MCAHTHNVLPADVLQGTRSCSHVHVWSTGCHHPCCSRTMCHHGHACGRHELVGTLQVNAATHLDNSLSLGTVQPSSAVASISPAEEGWTDAYVFLTVIQSTRCMHAQLPPCIIFNRTIINSRDVCYVGDPPRQATQRLLSSGDRSPARRSVELTGSPTTIPSMHAYSCSHLHTVCLVCIRWSRGSNTETAVIREQLREKQVGAKTNQQ
jgi:hypothetical protein